MGHSESTLCGSIRKREAVKKKTKLNSWLWLVLIVCQNLFHGRELIYLSSFWLLEACPACVAVLVPWTYNLEVLLTVEVSWQPWQADKEGLTAQLDHPMEQITTWGMLVQCTVDTLNRHITHWPFTIIYWCALSTCLNQGCWDDYVTV